MTREINGRIVMVVSSDGTRCAAECPHAIKHDGTSIHDAPDGCDYDDAQWFCMAHGGRDMEPAYTGPDEETFIGWLRLPACIAAEQAAASVPSCEGDATIAAREVQDAIAAAVARVDAASTGHLGGGARALDASEALREARVQGMREGLSITKGHACAYADGSEIAGDDVEVDYECAEEAVEAAIEAVRKGER